MGMPSMSVGNKQSSAWANSTKRGVIWSSRYSSTGYHMSFGWRCVLQKNLGAWKTARGD